ncbi:uncharacterized protein LOC117109547 [Anneissia japonica]|uniref:uncharacterized protein LOC117109547 n=1 Tax=Anneissia japonica TaxID=1529436 RepID=UPI0014256194|nr:uncharacterized protein LOC117109547 [Anneissia japonica]
MDLCFAVVKNVSLCLLVLLNFILQSFSFSGFNKEPTNEKEIEGGLAYFTCIVMELKSTEYVSWKKNSQIISNGANIIDEQIRKRYSIDFNEQFGKYNLQILNVKRRDEGEYVCTVLKGDGKTVAESNSANFTVLQTPREHYPICSPIAASYAVGQNIAVSCISERIEPPVRLAWMRNNIYITSKFVQEMTNDNYIVTYSFVAKKSDNRALFSCELTTSANPSIKRNCSSGPINIIYAPLVRIQQTRNVIIGKEAIFICYSDANPQEVTFEWTFKPPIDRHMYMLENDRILRILYITTNLNGTKVMCQVTNSIGSGSNVLYINVERQNIVEKTKGSNEENPDTTNSRNKQKAQDTKSNNKPQESATASSDPQVERTVISISLIVAIAVACIVVILGLAMIPVGYMRYSRRQPSDTVSRGRPVSIPDVYFEPKDHVDPMLPQLGLAAPWMRTVGVQVPGECEYDMTYTQVSPQSRQAYYSQRMYTATENITKMQFLVLFILTSIYPSNSFTGFRKEPQSDRQPEGGVAYFNCMVISLNSVEYVSWIHNGKKISEDEIIIGDKTDERYTIHSDTLLGAYNLNIQNIQRMDSGQFVCTVFERENNVIAQSQPANLTVLQIPREHYPLCSPISASYNIGTTIIVTCTSELTDPLALLSWKQNDAGVRPAQVEALIDGDMYKISYSFIASENNQRSIFTCEMTTPANTAIRRNCSTGPINILYAPHVRIEQTDVAILGKEAIFICYSDSNPPEVTFEWTFTPPLDKTMYTLENERILRILNMQKNINGTIIECKVKNSIGSRSQTFKIIIFSSGSKNTNSPFEKGNINTGIEEDNLDTEKANSKYTKSETVDPVNRNKKNEDFSVSLVIAIAVACIIAILGLALIPVGYMRYTRRQPSDTVSRGRPVSIPDVYFEPKDHVDPMLPQLGLAAPWMRTVGVQVPGECEYDVTYVQVSPQSRQAYYSQRMYTAASLQKNITKMQIGLLMFLLLLACIYPSRSFTGFRLEPQNNRQPEGGVAYFNCMLVGLNNMEYVSWIHDGKKISEDGTILNNQLDDRYYIDGNAFLGIFNLHIRNVQREDSGSFVCTVFNRKNHLIAQSQPANLTVLQIPRENYPLCSTISASYKIGESIVVTCRSEITDPLADLTWKRNDAEVRSSQVETSIKTDAYIISYSFIASKNDQRSTFTCEMTTPANTAIRRNCSTGPINVLYAPHVRIQQTDVVILGNEAIFICYSDSNPPEVKFEWNFYPPLDENKYTLENDRILRILNTEKDINGTIIECKVTNSIGSRSQTSKIIIFSSSSKDFKSPIEDKIKTDIEENNPFTEKTNSKHTNPETIDSKKQDKKNADFSVSLVIAIAVTCIIVILGLALIPVGYMRYTRRQPSDTISRGRPVSIPDVYFEPKDHVDPMLPQLGLAAPWMRTVGVQVPGECEYDVTYTQVSPQSRQAYYSQRMYTAASL